MALYQINYSIQFPNSQLALDYLQNLLSQICPLKEKLSMPIYTYCHILSQLARITFTYIRHTRKYLGSIFVPFAKPLRAFSSSSHKHQRLELALIKTYEFQESLGLLDLLLNSNNMQMNTPLYPSLSSLRGQLMIK